jgi:hypothetical protein
VASVEVQVSGVRAPSSGACDAAGLTQATTYAASFTCTGTGALRCGRIEGLAPGLWVHRVALQVPGSGPQVQAQRGLVLGASGGGISNVVEWTVFGRTFVVGAATDDAVLAAFDAAAQYTATEPGPALVRFDPLAFPGAASPVTVAMRHQAMAPFCDADAICGPPLDGRATTYCFAASRVTVDALDGDALPGAVELDVGPCQRSLLRMYGRDNVLRGLVLRGGGNGAPTIPVDTIAITGAAAIGNRVEQCRIVGPTQGDGLSVEQGASAVWVIQTEVLGAEDKGIKVTTGGEATIAESCVHDNANGGV